MNLVSILKLPTENDLASDFPTKENELDELQRMVQENEKALKRANTMIADLRKHLGAAARKSAPVKARRKK